MPHCSSLAPFTLTLFAPPGTLVTVPAIDFARMRQLCGVPQGRPILETVLAYPEPKRTEALGLIKQVERV
jgi:hypothetical protein